MALLRQVLKQTLSATLSEGLLLVRGSAKRAAEWTGDTSSPVVSLTFDDGPHPEHTPRLLDSLAEAGIHATFFVIGERAQRYPYLIRRIVDEGHELGNHTLSHSEPREISAAAFGDEIARTRHLLHDLTGIECSLVRPPKGTLTIAKCLAAWSQYQTLVLWNIDPRDYAMKTRVEMDRWVESYTPRCGDIVLMHDRCPYAEFAVETFCRAPRFERTQFVPVSCWLECPTDGVPDSPERHLVAAGDRRDA